jgi:hypothetical protein
MARLRSWKINSRRVYMQDIEVRWKTNVYSKVDAQTVAEEIASIGDNVTPQQIVDFAKNENTEIHECFTWDIEKAAEKYWLYEARQVVCNLVIKRVDKQGEEKPTSIRVFHKTDNETGYKPTVLILKNADEYEKLLNRAKQELLAFKNKYSRLSELEKIFEAIDEL